jgi:very-short-patch-repair endonuclease
MTISTKEKMSLSQKERWKKIKEQGIKINSNRIITWGDKISKALIGKKLSESHRKNMSIAHKGIIPWNKGLRGFKRSEETKVKMSLANKKVKRTKEWCENISIAQRNKKLSKETIQKIKEARAKQILPMRDTSIEIKIQNFLKQLGIDFLTHQYIKDIEHSYQCDILIPSMSIVIECDGNYWHKYPVGREIDNLRTKELIKNGWRVIRLWESEIKTINLEDFKNGIYSY